MQRRAFLLFMVILSLLASVGTGAEKQEPLRIATFEADVTPPLGSPLCHGNVQPAQQIVDPLSARGIILLGSQRPVVLCSVDWVAISNAAHDTFRQALAEAVGTSPDRVAVHTVHPHDTPGIDFSTEALLAAHGLGGKMFDPAFANEAIRRTAEAAGRAVAAPHRVTHLGCGMGKVEKVASNRRILGPDGKCIMTRMSSCRNQAAIAAPEGIIDPYVRLLSLWDGDRPLVSITYYATHPQSYYGRGGVSYDFVGMARAMREAAIPEAAHLHFNGAGGDVAAGKYNDGSPENRPKLAGRLAKGMEAAWEAMKKVPVSAADVDWQVCPVELPLRDTLDEAVALGNLENEKLPARERIRAARDLAWVRRMRSGHRIEIGCLRLGPARVLHVPGELCVGYQLAAQKMRPDAFVSMAAYGDDGPGYICMKIAYSQGGYETGRVSRVAPEVEDVLMSAIRSLLNADSAIMDSNRKHRDAPSAG